VNFRQAQTALREASTDLEALRPQATVALGRADMQPIQDAWELALARFTQACTDYVEAAKNIP